MKFLRVLQDKAVTMVGASHPRQVDVRIVAATNKNLRTLVERQGFREDLFFRLNVIPIFVPPLRDRGDDIRLLAEHFIAQLSREYGRRPKTLDPAAMAALRRYLWPGNVRELRNVLERLMIMVAGDVITDRHLSLPGTSAAADTPWFVSGADAPMPLHEARERFEREYIVRVLEAQHGNMSRTADVLGVERSNLIRAGPEWSVPPA